MTLKLFYDSLPSVASRRRRTELLASLRLAYLHIYVCPNINISNEQRRAESAPCMCVKVARFARRLRAAKRIKSRRMFATRYAPELFPQLDDDDNDTGELEVEVYVYPTHCMCVNVCVCSGRTDAAKRSDTRLFQYHKHNLP